MIKITGLMAGVYAANCYIVYDDVKKDGFIVDPGGDSDDIQKKLKQLGVTPKFIVLTHGHGDHIGAVDALREKFDLPVWVHEEEEALLADCKMNMSRMIPGPDIEITADHLYLDGGIIDPDHFHIEIIHTPGHTAGSSCLKIGKKLISGDTLFKGSVGRSDLPTASTAALEKSLEHRLAVLEPDTEVFPGHGAKTSIGYELKTNPFMTPYQKSKK